MVYSHSSSPAIGLQIASGQYDVEEIGDDGW